MEIQASGFPRRVGPTALSVSDTIIFTADRKYVIERFMLSNVGDTPQTADIYIVAPGASPALSNKIAHVLEVPANDIHIVEFPIVLNVNDRIYASATSNVNMTFNINGTQFGVQ